MPGTDKLSSNGFVSLARIVAEEFEDSGERPEVRIGTVLLPVGGGIGAYTNQLGHVLLEQAPVQSSSPNVVTQAV